MVICGLGVAERQRSSAEWQTSREKLSFQSRQIGKGIFAEAELLPTGFLTPLQVRPQVAPALLIPGAKLLGRESLLTGYHGSDDANGTTYHHPRNSPTSTRGSSLMDPCHPKAMFQLIIGTRQSLDVIAMKEPSREVLGDVTKMFNGLTQWSHLGFLFLHLPHKSHVALSNLCPGVLLMIG